MLDFFGGIRKSDDVCINIYPTLYAFLYFPQQRFCFAGLPTAQVKHFVAFRNNTNKAGVGVCKQHDAQIVVGYEVAQPRLSCLKPVGTVLYRGQAAFQAKLFDVFVRNVCAIQAVDFQLISVKRELYVATAMKGNGHDSHQFEKKDDGNGDYEHCAFLYGTGLARFAFLAVCKQQAKRNGQRNEQRVKQ